MQEENNNSWLNSSVIDWKNWTRLIILITVTLIVFFLFLYSFGKFIWPIFVRTGIRINYQNVSLEIGEKDQLIPLVVYPQGWNKTTISVKEGDKITISAAGRVTFMGFEGEKDREQKEYERRWLGPQGLRPEDIKNAHDRKRLEDTAHTRIYSKANSGELLAVIAPSEGNIPKKEQREYHPISLHGGDKLTFEVGQKGLLWMVINESLPEGHEYDEDHKNWKDNLGFFSVNIAKTSKN